MRLIVASDTITRRSGISTGLLLSVLASITGILLASPARAERTIELLKTRPGVTIRYLLHAPDGPSKAVLLLFPGSTGKGHFSEADGQIRLGENFLVRTSPLFVEKGFTVVVPDVPSDQPDGMSDRFRTSTEHAQDIGKIIDALKEKRLGPFHLIGTSRGTISVAHLGSTLSEDAVRAIVLTASFADLTVENIKVPALIVHHRDDGCRNTTLAGAAALRARVRNGLKVDFVEIRGGSLHRETPGFSPSGLKSKKSPNGVNPCGPLSPHGFFGSEETTVTVIVDWLSGRPVPAFAGE